MRELKFRAWWEFEDGYKMIGMEELWELDGEEFCIFTILTTPEERQDDEETAFMQYTGLKDKNGKEIYEGDIIQIPSWRKERFKVEFKAGMFRAVMGERKVSLATFKGEVGCEVIGNIYENPELLKEEE